MEGEASRKVPGGKLVKVKAEFEEVIDNVEIRGDFFIEPAEALEELEEKLEGLDLESSQEEIVEKLGRVDAKLIGFSREDIAEALKQAVGGEDE